MKKILNCKFLCHKILALGGFHAFMFTLGLDNPLVIATITLMTVVLMARIFFKKHYMDLLFPLASGLLLFPMKLFYWDRPDYLERGGNLLLIALLFSLVVAIRHFRLIKRFLIYFNTLSLKKRLLFLFILAETIFILASGIMTLKNVKLGGDEPHYLVISQSIAKDGDINVFNQYARDLYREFVDVRMTHHARVGKGFKVWYSYGHLPGLSITLAPFFLFKLPNPVLYFLIRSYLGIFGALFALLIYLFALKIWKHRSLALYITVVYTFTAPVFFYAIHIFAELQASLLILAALYLLLFAEKPRNNSLRTLLAGLSMSITVFWGMKYAIFIFFFGAGFFVYFILRKKTKQALLLAIFPALFLVLFLGFLYFAYGNFDPMSIYNGVMTPEQEQAYRSGIEHIPFQQRVETMLGIMFDQRDGLLLYNPFYFFAIPGLILALARIRKYWPHLLISAAGFAFILFIAYSTVRPGYCPQARYVVPMTWVLMLFAIIYYRETANDWFRRIMLVLPVYGFLVVGYQVFHPFTLYQSVTHINLNRPGLMFQYWSNFNMDISKWLPSFVKVPGNFNYLPNLVFLLLTVVLILFSLKKMKTYRFRFAPVVAFFLMFTVFSLFPKIPDYNPILLAKEQALPCKIYGESVYPTRTKERKFELTGKKQFSFTLSTLSPAEQFVMELENHSENNESVTIRSFDKEIKSEQVLKSEYKKIMIQKPLYKKVGNRYFYRFHLNVTPRPSTPPQLFLQMYPL